MMQLNKSVLELVAKNMAQRSMPISTRLLAPLFARSYTHIRCVAINKKCNPELLFKNYFSDVKNHQIIIEKSIKYFENKNSKQKTQETFTFFQSPEFTYGSGGYPITKFLLTQIEDDWIKFAKTLPPGYLIGIGTSAYYEEENYSEGKYAGYNVGIWIESHTGNIIRIYKAIPAEDDGWDKQKFEVKEKVQLDKERIKVFTGPDGKSFAVLFQICLDHKLGVGEKYIPSQMVTWCLVPAEGMRPFYQDRPHYLFLVDGKNKVIDPKTGDSYPVKEKKIIAAFNKIDKSQTTGIIDWLWKSIKAIFQDYEIEEVSLKDQIPDVKEAFYSQPIPIPKPDEKLSLTQSLFPYLGSEFNYAFSDEPILLNGMKVLFDNPTPTTPITLQPKQRGTNNGR